MLIQLCFVLLPKEVFDKDVFQNDFMGQVTLTTDQIREAAKVSFQMTVSGNSIKV